VGEVYYLGGQEDRGWGKRATCVLGVGFSVLKR